MARRQIPGSDPAYATSDQHVAYEEIRCDFCGEETHPDDVHDLAGEDACPACYKKETL